MSLTSALAAISWPNVSDTNITPIGTTGPLRARIMKALCLPAALLLSSGCTAANITSVGPTPPMSAMTPLNGEALRRLFSTDYHTYLTPRSGAVIVSHPRSELFRPNGTYWRGTGRTGLEGTYAVEGDLLCVLGDRIPKQCRRVVPQGGNTYLLIDVSDSSQALVDLSRVR